MILAALFVFSKLFFTEERVANYRLDALAKNYYEEHFYGEYIRASKDSAEKTLAEFEKRGFGRTFLRQLLTFDENNGGNVREKLDEICDTNKTYVTYYPKSPYGKTDYEFKYVYSCNFD